MTRFEINEAKFLEALANGSTVTIAAETIGMSRQQAYLRRQNDAEFAQRWDDAIEQGTDRMVEIMRKRAAEKSDLLMMFDLKSRRPHIYRDNASISLTGHVTLENLVQAIATEKVKEIEQQRQAAVDEANTIDVEPDTTER